LELPRRLAPSAILLARGTPRHHGLTRVGAGLEKRVWISYPFEEIYGAITFYLAHEQEINAYLAQAEATFEVQAKALNAAARTANPALFQRLEQGRHARETTHQ